jgi:hypothetical protein
MSPQPSLRRIVKDATGQDVFKCQACYDCDVTVENEMDIPLASLIQLVLQNDEESLHCRTLWSDSVMEASRGVCKRGLDLCAVITALREESKRRDGQ